MSADTISIAIPPELRDLIAQAADERKTTQDIAATTVLQEQIAEAETARESGELLAERYLSHPRLTSIPVNERTTVHIDRQTNDRAAALAAVIGQQIGQNVPKGRVIQALLWAALAPAQSEDRRELPQAATPRDTITARIPVALNSELIDLAMRLGISREAVTDELLDRGFADLAADPTLLNILTQQRTQASTNTTATLQVPRRHDGPLQQLAGQAFNGVKSRALQAVLRYSLDRTEKPENMPDRQVTINGQLYARVARVSLEKRATHGRSVSIREFVETAVEQAVEREEAGISKPPKPRRKAKER